MHLAGPSLVITAALCLAIAFPATAETKKTVKSSTIPVAAPVATPAPAGPLKLAVGQPLKLDGFEFTLNKVVQPGAEALGGALFTEYNLTVSNTSPDKDLLISNATLSVAGEVRQAVRDLDEIAFQDMSGRSTAAVGGSAAVGFVSGMLGPLAALGGQVLAHAGASKLLVDDPQKWREELKKRGFQNANETGVSIFPTESATGSIWFKQSASEAAERMQVYVKQGGSSRIIRLDLVDMPVPVAKRD
jgi:hypothetical protein